MPTTSNAGPLSLGLALLAWIFLVLGCCWGGLFWPSALAALVAIGLGLKSILNTDDDLRMLAIAGTMFSALCLLTHLALYVLVHDLFRGLLGV